MQSPRYRGLVRAYIASIAFWYSMSLLMGLQYLPLDRHHLWASFLNLLVQAAPRAFALSLWAPPIFFLVQKYLHWPQDRARYILLWGVGALPFVALHTTIAWLVTPPYTSRSFPTWVELMKGGFADETFIYIAMVVAAHGYQYLKRVRTQEAEKLEYQRALAASELQALKMQLQPHFLFNTLHGIATLVDENAEIAKEMIVKLSNLLRVALDRGSSDLIPLEGELRFVREYLDLEKIRFGRRLKIEWLVAPESCQLLVPQMILQPLVENAIKHGIASLRDGGWIKVAATVDDGILQISVRNSAGSKPLNGPGVGLRNIEARLKYLYSGDASLHVTFEDDRTFAASLALPALNSRTRSTHRLARAASEVGDPSCAFSSLTTKL